MATKDIINGLKHVRDDHPCCEPFISWAIWHIETEQVHQERFPSRDLLALKIWLANLPRELDSAQRMLTAAGEQEKLRKSIQGAYELADFYVDNMNL